MARAQRARKLTGSASASARSGLSHSVLALLAQAGGNLPEAQRLAQQLIDVLPVPVFFKARDGRYLGVNRAWEEFFGIARQNFVGKQVADLYPQSPWVAAEHEAMDQELWKKPGSQSYEIKIATRHGPRSTIYHKATFNGADGKVAGIIGTIIDVTGRKNAKRALREAEQRFRQTFELAASGIAQVGLQGRFRHVNRSLCRILGYSAEELTGMTVKQVSHPDDRAITDAERSRMHAGDLENVHFEKRYLRKDGSAVWVDLTVALVRDAEGRPQYEIAVFDDITERKRADEALRQQTERLQLGQTAARMIIMDWNIREDRLTWSDSPEWLRGPLPPGGRYPLFKEQIHPEDRGSFLATRNRALESLQGQTQEFRLVRTDGEVIWVMSRQRVFADAEGKAARMLAAMFDITDRKRAEQALRESEERFRSLTALSSDWYWEQDEEFRFTMVSRGIFEAVGIPPEDFVGKTRWHAPLHGVSDEQLAEHKATLEAHKPFTGLEYGRHDPGGNLHYISTDGEPIFDPAGRFRGYRGVGRDVTARRSAQEALKAAHDELARSNAELEQFAYVASHDLQEPLRMIASYTQLLGKRYGERLEGDAAEFMGYIVDGAARMKQLIEDLLAYSRVGTRGREFRPMSLEAAFRRALANLRSAIDESGAAVTSDLLPEVEGDESQILQLLQNLIGNALKFRGAQAPRIHVSCSSTEKEWEVSVKDNGIGIDPQYFERIFMVFQRLHDKGQYPGTGIGLAICKKVVDRHGGRIWVTSGTQPRPGGGSTFHFTLPRKRGKSHG
jgi:PAS domain S-box-containing protein